MNPSQTPPSMQNSQPKSHPISSISTEVANWSRDNFGNQKGIEYLAPLLGLVEELSELETAEYLENSEEITDAVGDIGIYMLDFLARAEINVAVVWPTLIDSTITANPIVFLGRICHCCLKRHQGIRGFDNDDHFRNELEQAVIAFLTRINNKYDLTAATINTWQRVVSKRNWKKPQD